MYVCFPTANPCLFPHLLSRGILIYNLWQPGHFPTHCLETQHAHCGRLGTEIRFLRRHNPHFSQHERWLSFHYYLLPSRKFLIFLIIKNIKWWAFQYHSPVINQIKLGMTTNTTPRARTTESIPNLRARGSARSPLPPHSPSLHSPMLGKQPRVLCMLGKHLPPSCTWAPKIHMEMQQSKNIPKQSQKWTKELERWING